MMFKTFTAISLALLTLVTSLTFSVNMHYCQGEVQSFALFAKAKSCQHLTVACPIHGTMQVEKDCCSDEIKIIEGQDHEAAFANTIIVEVAPIYFVVPTFLFDDSFLFISDTPSFLHFKPPAPSGRHLRVLVQSFLC
ncbi:MAG TPA: hypothetical protein PKD70_06925 [Saprospiraceae bacterium]|nr:hypothetical protein [Saprospiraceae bacterium]